MEVIEEEAEVGREMVERLLGGESLRQLAFELNRRGVRSTLGNEWSASTLGRWMRAPRPAGLRVYRDERFLGDWEPIITPDQRLEAIATIARRGRAGGRAHQPEHLLVGLIYCGICNGRLKPMGFRTLNGQMYPRYQCVGSPGAVNCGRVAITQAGVDTFVRDEYFEFLSRSALRPLPDQSDGHQLQRLIDEDAQALSDVRHARFVTQAISAETFDKSRLQLQARLDTNQSRLVATARELAHLQDTPRLGTRETVECWWNTRSLEEQRAALALAITRVNINPAKPRGGNRFNPDRVRIEFSSSL